MKHLFFTLCLFIVTNVFAQTYKDPVSFKSDLWLVQTFEEGTYVPPDTLLINWEKKKIKADKYAIYVDISSKGTLVGIKYPSKLTLSSEGLPNNGFMGEKWFGKYSMHIQSQVKDEEGNIWWVTVGKDSVFEEVEKREEGRIYVVIQGPNGIKPSWYFTIKSFGKNK